MRTLVVDTLRTALTKLDMDARLQVLRIAIIFSHSSFLCPFRVASYSMYSAVSFSVIRFKLCFCGGYMHCLEFQCSLTYRLI